MDNLWSFLLQTLTLSAVGVVLLALKRLLDDKLSPRWQYGVWLIFALRALVPAGLLGRTLLPWGQVALEALRMAVERGLGSALTAPLQTAAATAPIPLFPRGFPPPRSITDLLFYLYAAGAAVSLLWFFLVYLRLRLSLRRGQAPGEKTMARLRKVAGHYGLPLPRRVITAAEVESAFVCGLIRPVLVLPERPVDDKVLLHELLHLRYGDVWAGVVICLIRCLHWCNPLVWLCCNRAQNDCEALCDQRVLERLEGEERRAYGVILLSMADDRYARAPGTSSMANGGRNIRRRIEAIARFKRYPGGMGLVSVCLAVVLAAACLGGSSAQAAVPGGMERGGLALARAAMNRPTTVAGALDTYGKSILCDSPLYRFMVLPEGEEQQQAWSDSLLPYREQELENYPLWDFWDLGFSWSRPAWQAEWQAVNLLPDGAGGYTGWLFFLPLREDDTCGAMAQQVAVRPDGAYWTVEALTPPEVRPEEYGDRLPLVPSRDTPWTTYRGEAGGLTLEVDYQLALGVYSQVNPTSPGLSFFSSSAALDPLPRPDTSFTQMADGGTAARAWRDGEELTAGTLRLRCVPMTEEETAHGDLQGALAREDHWFSLDLGELGENSYYEGANDYYAGETPLSCMPSALAVSFTLDGQEYTLMMQPEGGEADD